MKARAYGINGGGAGGSGSSGGGGGGGGGVSGRHNIDSLGWEVPKKKLAIRIPPVPHAIQEAMAKRIAARQPWLAFKAQLDQQTSQTQSAKATHYQIQRKVDEARSEREKVLGKARGERLTHLNGEVEKLKSQIQMQITQEILSSKEVYENALQRLTRDSQAAIDERRKSLLSSTDAHDPQITSNKHGRDDEKEDEDDEHELFGDDESEGKEDLSDPMTKRPRYESAEEQLADDEENAPTGEQSSENVSDRDNQFNIGEAKEPATRLESSTDGSPKIAGSHDGENNIASSKASDLKRQEITAAKSAAEELNKMKGRMVWLLKQVIKTESKLKLKKDEQSGS